MSIGELRNPQRADLLRLAAVTVAGQSVTVVVVWYLTAGVVGGRTFGEAVRTTLCAVIVIDFAAREIRHPSGGLARGDARAGCVARSWRWELTLASSRAGGQLMMEPQPDPENGSCTITTAGAARWRRHAQAPKKKSTPSRIIERRLDNADLSDVSVAEIIDTEAVTGLVSRYDESGRNLRQVLNVLQFALDHAVDEQPELLTFPHIRHGIQAARPSR